jgi:hypothetical protein
MFIKGLARLVLLPKKQDEIAVKFYVLSIVARFSQGQV